VGRSPARGLRAMQVACALAVSVPVPAQDDDPSLDFLEYLGSWEDEDEAWYVEVQIEETKGEGAQTDESSPPTTHVEHTDD
jgi:hypothetical protein